MSTLLISKPELFLSNLKRPRSAAVSIIDPSHPHITPRAWADKSSSLSQSFCVSMKRPWGGTYYLERIRGVRNWQKYLSIFWGFIDIDSVRIAPWRAGYESAWEVGTLKRTEPLASVASSLLEVRGVRFPHRALTNWPLLHSPSLPPGSRHHCSLPAQLFTLQSPP